VERRLFSELNESECSSQDRDTTETNHKPLLCRQCSCPSIDRCFNVHGNSQTWLNPNELNVESSDSKTGLTFTAGGLFQGLREFTWLRLSVIIAMMRFEVQLFL
jgi:hypothetical protein